MDIFGRKPDDYSFVRALQEAGAWDGYQADNAQMRSASTPRHDFDALQARAADDASAFGYLTNNLLSIQTMVDEVMYTAHRLPMWMALDESVGEGATAHAIRVRDAVGESALVTAPGYDAPSATVSEGLTQVPMRYYGLDAVWSMDELRGAMMAGFALDTESIEQAVTGSLKTMERTGLLGDGQYQGLFNLDAAATPTGDQVQLSTQAASMTFSDLTATQIRSLINGEISAIISDSAETIGRNLNTGMTVYLPGEQYDLLTTLYMGDDAERTLLRSIKQDNPWTEFSGSPLMVERVIELAAAGASNTDRMVVGLKHPRIIKMCVSISPRVLRVLDKGRVICAQVESKFSPAFLLRPFGIRYVDAI